jgi:hypothetical protein
MTPRRRAAIPASGVVPYRKARCFQCGIGRAALEVDEIQHRDPAGHGVREQQVDRAGLAAVRRPDDPAVPDPLVGHPQLPPAVFAVGEGLHHEPAERRVERRPLVDLHFVQELAVRDRQLEARLVADLVDDHALPVGAVDTGDQSELAAQRRDLLHPGHEFDRELKPIGFGYGPLDHDLVGLVDDLALEYFVVVDRREDRPQVVGAGSGQQAGPCPAVRGGAAYAPTSSSQRATSG